MPYISEIFLMDDIFSLEDKATEKYNMPIYNVSHWNSSETYKSFMRKCFVPPKQSLPWDYYYTYSISPEDRRKVLQCLGVNAEQLHSTMGLLLQSSTIAIINMINLLVQFKYRRLCILEPAYFSVSSCCSCFSLDYGLEQISFTNGMPKIPTERIIAGGYDCIWITSPIFCTGYYPNEDMLADIARIKAAGITIIFDESLALPNRELIRLFPVDKHQFAIYSPHKAISINGFKFSVLVCDKYYEEFLEQWVDIFSGALAVSNRDAVFHYISSNYFDFCYPSYCAYIKKTKACIESLVQKCKSAYLLPNTQGHYISIFTNIRLKKEQEAVTLLSEIIDTCKASLIPSSINGFNLCQGFSFRVNLTGDPLELQGAIGRILQYLDGKN